MADIVDLLQIKIERAREKLSEDTLNAIAAVDWRAAVMSMREKHGYNFEQLAALELETELVLCGLVSPENYQKELEEQMNISKAAANVLVEEMNRLVFGKIKEELIKNTERKKIFQKKTAEKEEIGNLDRQILDQAGIDIVPAASIPNRADTGRPAPAVKKEAPLESREDMLKKVENPNFIPAQKAPEPVFPGIHPVRDGEGPQQSSVSNGIHPILAEKITNSVKIPTATTEHRLVNTPETDVPTVKASDAEEPKTASAAYPPKKDPYRLSPED